MGGAYRGAIKPRQSMPLGGAQCVQKEPDSTTLTRPNSAAFSAGVGIPLFQIAPKVAFQIAPIRAALFELAPFEWALFELAPFESGKSPPIFTCKQGGNVFFGTFWLGKKNIGRA